MMQFCCNFILLADDPYYCGMRARVPNFGKKQPTTAAVAAAAAVVAPTNGKSNGTISEKKSSGFFSKSGSKSKEKEKEKEKDKKEKEASTSPKHRPSVAQLPHPASFSTLYQLHQMQNGMLGGTMNGTMNKNGTFMRHNSQPEPYIWHAKSYESGIGESAFGLDCGKCSLLNSRFVLVDAELESPYPIYGRYPAAPGRGYVPVQPRAMYVSDWE